MRHTYLGLILAIGFATGGCSPAEKPLDIYFLDMMGGGSTLIVTPLGESVLIDTGSREPMHRDVDRIMRACEDAGLKQIDYLVTTHFDVDHYGGILELSKRIPIKTFFDNDTPPQDIRKRQAYQKLHPLYEQATGGKTKLLRAGDDIPLKNDSVGRQTRIRLHCVTSQKQIEGFTGNIDAPVEGYEIQRPDNSNNAASITLVLTYGDFKFFAGGDITWNVEHHLTHPVNRIGTMDLYQVTHHGLDMSNNPLLLKALSPTVCVAMNGPKKGIQPNTFKALRELPSMQAIYQIHYNVRYDEVGNTAKKFIANADNPNQGEFIKASVFPEQGYYTVTIGADGPTRKYKIKDKLSN
jgi:competence protein ComEC